MIRILVYLALLFAVAAGFAWLADRPGEIALVWQGYEIRSSLMVAAIAFAALFVALAILFWIVTTLVRAPRLFGDWLGGRRRDRGFRALSRGMVAVGAGDVKLARRYALESRKILGAEPMTLLLAAQSAQLSGDAPAARTAFEAMLEDPETRLLGLRGLFVEAERAGEHEAARHFASEAHQSAPALAWAGQALFAYQAAASDWRGALETLGSNTHAKLVDRGESHRLRAVLLTARGLGDEASNPEEARAAALEAVKLAPGLVPAATLAARLSARNSDYRRASKILEAAWKVEPHPEIAEAYLNVRPGDAAGDRLKRAEKLVTLRPMSAESHYALARAAFDARDFAAARRALGSVAESERTERYCLLMAEIEEAEGDRGRVREWLGRALRAPRDPSWMADGYVFTAWAPVSPVSGRIDAFEWRVPTLSLGGEERPLIDLMPAPETSPAEMPVLEAAPVQRAAPPSPPVEPAAVQPSRPVQAGRDLPKAPIPDDPGVEDPDKRIDPIHLQ
ncbi:HemY protein [Kaistia hirudinis]|uniref:HemY protein n=1 Tax=Kaistia hirudinis TaxID=1293440 RepID=A0A840AR63_9HYPH|nr:heme biosynthesis HemY N-terminal domain-containing protein [Kaistia hirudinis]MBB3931537.1 HemY protein [Kaistia hirudinis]